MPRRSVSRNRCLYAALFLLASLVWIAACGASEPPCAAEPTKQPEPASVTVRITRPTALYTLDSKGRVVSAGTAKGPWLSIPTTLQSDTGSRPGERQGVGPVDDPVAEGNMLRTINLQRSRNGLTPVVMDESLRAVARGHSMDMAVRGYFSHTSPDGDSLKERLRHTGISTRFAAENLALGCDTELACKCLMESARHKANILKPEAKRIGIGVVSGRGAMWFTQVLTD